jgi:hypothetical protein
MGLVAFAPLAAAGAVTGHALVTRGLTKKTKPPIAYACVIQPRLRLDSGIEPVNEFDRMVVMLEGGHESPQDSRHGGTE